jgi:hypothetical protein
MSNKSAGNKLALQKTIHIFQPGVIPLGKEDRLRCYGKFLDLMLALENAVQTEKGEVLMWSVEVTGKGFKLEVGLCIYQPPSGIAFEIHGHEMISSDDQQFTCEKHASLSITREGPKFVYNIGGDCFRNCGPVVKQIVIALAREEETAGVG